MNKKTLGQKKKSPGGERARYRNTPDARKFSSTVKPKSQRHEIRPMQKTCA